MGLDNSFLKHRFNAKRILIGLTDELTCYCDDTSSNQLGSRGCVALVEHATKGKKHAEKVALRRYLHSIKLKIMFMNFCLVF